MAKIRQTHWLVSGTVIYEFPNPTQKHQLSFNTLVLTKVPAFIRDDLARAQNAMMQRFVTETEDGKTAKITDVFINAVSNLGQMTDSEFHKGFDAPAAKVSIDQANDQMNLELN